MRQLTECNHSIKTAKKLQHSSECNATIKDKSNKEFNACNYSLFIVKIIILYFIINKYKQAEKLKSRSIKRWNGWWWGWWLWQCVWCCDVMLCCDVLLWCCVVMLHFDVVLCSDVVCEMLCVMVWVMWLMLVRWND